MNPLKIYWKPESLESTSFSQINTPPIGKPDPSLPRIPGQIRPRVHQKAQVGPTCVYYAARKLSPHFGKAEPLHFMRLNEKMLSWFRRIISMTQHIQDGPFSEPVKSYMTASVIACSGFEVHFPWQALCLSIIRLFTTPFSGLVQAPSEPINLQSQFHQMANNLFRRFGACSMRFMLYRMTLSPLNWTPFDGPGALISALRTNLYIWCMGDFGKGVYRPLQVIQTNSRCGPIYGGNLRPIAEIQSGYLTLHAIVVIGVRSLGFMKGDVYYVDPQDPSGPSVMPKIYHLSIKDFFYRIKDSLGNSPMKYELKEFAWIGDPSLFLA